MNRLECHCDKPARLDPPPSTCRRLRLSRAQDTICTMQALTVMSLAAFHQVCGVNVLIRWRVRAQSVPYHPTRAVPMPSFTNLLCGARILLTRDPFPPIGPVTSLDVLSCLLLRCGRVLLQERRVRPGLLLPLALHSVSTSCEVRFRSADD
jgi:hypothetical protein